MKSEIIVKKEWIEETQKKHINSFKGKTNYNRKASIYQHVTVTILGAVIAILSGLNIELIEDYTRIAILILGSIITITSAYKTFFDNKIFWVKYMTTVNKFKKIQAEFSYYLAGKKEEDITLEALETFRIKIQKILDDINGGWESSRMKED